MFVMNIFAIPLPTTWQRAKSTFQVTKFRMRYRLETRAIQYMHGCYKPALAFRNRK